MARKINVENMAKSNHPYARTLGAANAVEREHKRVEKHSIEQPKSLCPADMTGRGLCVCVVSRTYAWVLVNIADPFMGMARVNRV